MSELQNKYFAVLELENYPASFFYSQSEYKEYLHIKKHGKAMQAKAYTFRRVLQHLQENGVKATIGRIVSKLK